MRTRAEPEVLTFCDCPHTLARIKRVGKVIADVIFRRTCQPMPCLPPPQSNANERPVLPGCAREGAMLRCETGLHAPGV